MSPASLESANLGVNQCVCDLGCEPHAPQGVWETLRLRPGGQGGPGRQPRLFHWVPVLASGLAGLPVLGDWAPTRAGPACQQGGCRAEHQCRSTRGPALSPWLPQPCCSLCSSRSVRGPGHASAWPSSASRQEVAHHSVHICPPRASAQDLLVLSPPIFSRVTTQLAQPFLAVHNVLHFCAEVPSLSRRLGDPVPLGALLTGEGLPPPAPRPPRGWLRRGEG